MPRTTLSTGRPGRRRGTRMMPAVALTAMLVIAAPTTVVASDQEPPPEPEGGITEQMIHESVTVFDESVRVFDVATAVRELTTDDSVTSLGDGVESNDGQTVISLSTDLLFGPNSWDLPTRAPDLIGDLVEDVPEGVTVEVTGHTDSVPTGQDFDNQELSENRADAVADVLTDQRPDLDLDVSGVGDSDPAVTEDDGDPETFAANRRVEIAYGG